MSKRKLLQLVQQRHVAGWDDPADADDHRAAAPRLHAGVDPRFLRADRRGEEGKRHRRGAARAQRARGSEPPRAAGDGRAASAEGRASRTIPEGQVEEVDVINNPEDASAGTRKVPFSRELYIERDDFMEDPPKKFFRLSPGKEVRLRCAYFITCTEVVKDDRGEIVELRCTYDPGDARRRFAGRPAREGDAALGVGRPRRRRSKCGSTIGCSRSRIPNACRRARRFSTTSIPHSLEVLRDCRAEPSLARRDARRRVSSSSGSATSASIPIRGRARWSSTAPCRCATPGRRIAADRARADRHVEYHITQYELEQGALEIQYIEEFFGEFPRKKTAAEIVRRLEGRAHLILLATAPLPDDPGTVVPVSFKVAHEITHRRDRAEARRSRPPAARLRAVRRPARALHLDRRHAARLARPGHFRALTEQQELWAIEQGFDEIVVKTKNKFYDMRGTLDHLRFEVVKYERTRPTTPSRRCTLSKKLLPDVNRAYPSRHG